MVWMQHWEILSLTCSFLQLQIPIDKNKEQQTGEEEHFTLDLNAMTKSASRDLRRIAEHFAPRFAPPRLRETKLFSWNQLLSVPLFHIHQRISKYVKPKLVLMQHQVDLSESEYATHTRGDPKNVLGVSVSSTESTTLDRVL